MNDGRTPLERMLEARSVAVVGASAKTGSLGNQMMIELRRGGYTGAIYPVNPGNEEIDGLPCFASIGEVPEPVDLAILGVANHRIEKATRDAVEAGTGSLVTFSSLHDDDPEPGAPSLTQRLASMAREAGMAMCGGNGMGFVNMANGLRATGFATPDHVRQGPVAFVSHSGSAYAALSFNDRGIGFNLLISSGQEIVSTMADYMEHALSLPTTRVLALLLETMRDPVKFRAQLARAGEAGVPVIALKVGRIEKSKAMVTAHSGALAGEHGAYEALFEAFGVHEVRTLDEMADAMELFSCERRATGRGRGIATVHDSGGERALLSDVADDLHVPFAAISDSTRSRIAAALDPGLEADNPLDAWGTGIDADRIFHDSFMALHDDPDTAALAFVVDLTRDGEPYDQGFLGVAKSVFASSTKPFCVLSNLASAIASEEATILRDAGIPVLEGTRSGLVALRAMLIDRDARSRPAVVPPVPVDPGVRDLWAARLANGVPIEEAEGRRMLADYGVPMIETRTAGSVVEAVGAAHDIGWPVALKTAAPGVQHKSDVGGVVLGLADDVALRVAYEDIASRLGPRMIVSPMAPAGVEVALGIVRDPTFGPMVLVAAGGILVELLQDRVLALPPLDEVRSRALVDRLRSRTLLDGVRGAPPSDVVALASAISRLSLVATDLGDRIAALDVNPLIVSPRGCVAVDALVIPAGLD